VRTAEHQRNLAVYLELADAKRGIHTI